MRKYPLSLTIAFGLFGLPLTISAQTDSSRYDIGFLTLNKDFTQHVTIRGEDLAKMPFLNLSAAIRTWLFGAYTGPLTLAYVVDGNPVADVDIYSIYDIKEVTFVDNAVATAAFGNDQRELVLVTTWQGMRATGMRVMAQTGLVKGNEEQSATHTGVYHQYYVGADRSGKQLSFGGSAGWQRDIEPPTDDPNQSVHIITPENLARWRLNGWMDWRPDDRNSIGFRFGYGPQVYGDGYESTGGGGAAYRWENQLHSHLLTPEFAWEGHWLRGLSNKLTAVYLHASSDSRYDDVDSAGTNGLSVNQVSQESYYAKTDRFFLRDHLNYDTKAGNWHIIPAVDIGYQHIHEQSGNFDFQQGIGVSASSSGYEEKGSLFYVTPAIDLTLRRALNIGAGMMVNVSSKVEQGSGSFFPFATAALDLLHLNATSRGSSLKLFGSYARRSTLFIDDYSLSDLSGNGGSQSLYNIYHNTSGYIFYNGQPSNVTYPMLNEPGYWTWETGAAYTGANGRASLQYSYERRNFSLVYTNNYLIGFTPWTEDLHHLDLRYKLVDSKTVTWLTDLNVNLMRNSVQMPGAQVTGQNPDVAGDIAPADNSWTGGWVNRLQAGRFSAGLDLLYHFGETQVSFNTGAVSKVNSRVAPNCYAAYKWRLGKGMLELFAESSGLLRNKTSDLSDMRKYYSIGGSYSL